MWLELQTLIAAALRTALPAESLGPQLLAADGWTAGAGWSESPPGTFAHAGGVASLSHAAEPVPGAVYDLAWTVANRTAGWIGIAVGGTLLTGKTAGGAARFTATSTAPLAITPTADFDGALSALTLRRVNRVAVETVADAVVPDGDTVRVTRASSPPRPLYAQLSGVETLALECWTRDDDPAVASARLQDLEETAFAALRGLSRIDPITNIAITGIDPDGDLFRPAVGSRITLTISWRKPRQSTSL
jgi:hypothetical protein